VRSHELPDSSVFGRVAIVHDYLNQFGGAERVALELAQMWPSAPVHTSLYRPDSTYPEFRHHDVRTSFLQRVPVDKAFRYLLPLYPVAMRDLGAIDADLVISSSSAWAHGVRVRPGAFHAVYCYTPARWLYGNEYMGASSARQRLARPLLGPLRRWDRRAAARCDLYIAISAGIRDRIRERYVREAPIVHPPVDVDRFTPTARGERLLIVSRLLPYKRVDALVVACTKAGLSLDVVGTGPHLATLRAIAGPTVCFHGRLPDSEVTRLMQECRAFCLPGAEDFGITPVEAQAAGKPVIAYGRGGVLETVEPGVSGVFFDDHEPETILHAIRECDALTTTPLEIAALARRFSSSSFRLRLLEALGEAQGRPGGM
jgi:glycosyltransferase involved in cell wall biosynthesis